MRTGREPATLGEQILDLNNECFWYTYPPQFAREAVALLFALSEHIPKELLEGSPFEYKRDEWAATMRSMNNMNVEVTKED